MTRPSIAAVVACLAVAGVCLSAWAADRETFQDGPWSAPSTWVDGVLPGPDDKAIIKHDVNMDMTAVTTVAALEITSGGRLYSAPVTTHRLVVTGNAQNDGRIYLPFNGSSACSLHVGGIFTNAAQCTLANAKLSVIGAMSNTGTLVHLAIGPGDGKINVYGGLTNADTTPNGIYRPGTSSNYGVITVTGGFSNGGTYVNAGSGPLTVTGGFSNEGTYVNAGSGPLTVTGDFTNSDSFSNGGSGAITFNGSVDNQGSASFGNGTVTFSGGTDATVGGSVEPVFYNVTLNKSEPDNTLMLASDVQVTRKLSLSRGVFSVGQGVLTLGGTDQTGSVDVFSGGAFSAVGSGPDTSAVVTAVSVSSPYDFQVRNGGRIAARYAVFRWMNTSGIRVNSGAIVADAPDNFSDCSFDHGNAASGPILRIDNSQTIEMVSVSFDGSAGYNIQKQTDAGYITVIGGSGTRWGEAYERDPNNRIDWAPVAIGEQTGLPAGSRPRMATVIRGTLHLALDSIQHTAYRADLLDIMGRKTASLVPGTNDVRGLAPGVYYIKPNTDTGNRLERVVVAR